MYIYDYTFIEEQIAREKTILYQSRQLTVHMGELFHRNWRWIWTKRVYKQLSKGVIYIYILFASPHFLHPFIFRNQSEIYRVQLVFPKIGYPQIIHFTRVFHYKPSILGYPYFWKHPYKNFKKTQLTRYINCLLGVGIIYYCWWKKSQTTAWDL